MGHYSSPLQGGEGWGEGAPPRLLPPAHREGREVHYFLPRLRGRVGWGCAGGSLGPLHATACARCHPTSTTPPPRTTPSYAALQPELGTGNPVPGASAHWLEDYAPTTLMAAGRGRDRRLRLLPIALRRRLRPQRRGCSRPQAQGPRPGADGRNRAPLSGRRRQRVVPERQARERRRHRPLPRRRNGQGLQLRGPAHGLGRRRAPPKPSPASPPMKCAPTKMRPFARPSTSCQASSPEVRQRSTRRVLGLFEGTAPAAWRPSICRCVSRARLVPVPGRASRACPQSPRRHARLRRARARLGPGRQRSTAEPALVEHLLAAGAVVRMQIEYHRGRVPPK